MIAWVLIVVLLSAVSGVHGTPPGATLAISQPGLSYVQSLITPNIDKFLKDLSLPEIKKDIGGFDVHLFDIHTDAYDKGTWEFKFKSGSGLELELKDFTLSIHVHFDAKEDGFPYLSTAGTAEVKAKDATLKLTMGVKEKDGKPTLSVASTDIDLGDLDIDIKDGLIGDLLNALEGLFKKQLTDAIESAVQDGLNGVVSSLDKTLSGLKLTYSLADWGAEIRFDLTSDPSVTSSYLGVGVDGDVVNVKTPAPLPPQISPPTIPAFNAADTSHYLQFAISTYSFETAAWVYQQHGELKRVIPHTAIPSTFPVQLNTTDLAAFAPGLKQQFPNHWCQLKVSAVNVSTASMSAAKGLSLSVPLEVDVQVVTGPSTSAPGFKVGCQLGAAVSLAVSSTSLTGNITTLACDLVPLSSSVGPVHVAGLDVLIDLVLKLLLPLANGVLNKGFPLPSLDGVKLTHPAITFQDNSVIVATDFTYSK